MAYQPNNLSLRQAVALVCELTGMTTAEAEADIAAAGRDGAFQARAHEAAEIHDGLQWPLPIIDGVSYVPARFWGFTIRWQANELVRGREGATGVTIRRAAIERIWRPAAKEKEKADTAPRKRGPRPALGQRIERRMLEDLATGLAGTIGQICMTYALKLAAASIIAPFEYTKIGWAILFDLTLWGASPSFTTLLGAGIVMVTALYILYRETRHRQ